MNAHRPKKRRKTAQGVDRSNVIVGRLKANQAPEAGAAELVVAGLSYNASAILAFRLSDVNLTACFKALTDASERVNRGDLRDAEALLTAQAVTLNVVFTHLAHRAQMNIGEYPEAADRYMRLALKAQSQCRATVETVAVIKNPPTVFAKQANIAQGSQQVNNLMLQPAVGARARAGKLESEKTELLEAHGKRVDSATTGATGGVDSELAPVGTLHRPQDV